MAANVDSLTKFWRFYIIGNNGKNVKRGSLIASILG